MPHFTMPLVAALCVYLVRITIMEKVLLIGPGGAGKSTFAKEIGELTGIPVVHLDALYWKPGWIETSKDDWKRVVEGLLAQESWIIDGNYGGTLDLRLAAADTIIFFDLPPLLCIWRFLKRRIKFHNKNRPDMTEGCSERIDWSFIKWIYNYRRDRRPGIMQKLEAVKSEKTIVIFNSPHAVSKFTESIRGKYA